MENSERLKKIKLAMGIAGSYQDELLNVYITDAKNVLRSAGVPQETVESELAIGAIVRYVVDAWNYESGAAHMSPLFISQVAQLRAKGVAEGEQTTTSG